MSHPIGRRPRASVKLQQWTDKNNGKVIPGIAIYAKRGLAAHLTATEARAIADQLHDLADQLPEPASSAD